MKKLKQNDLFKHIDQFLKDKGIEIREAAPLGSRLKTGCEILTDTINNAQSTLGKAKDHMDDHLDKMRSIIHEKTAPRKTAKATPKKKKSKSKKAAPKKKAKAKKPAQKTGTRPKQAIKKKVTKPQKVRSTVKKAAKKKARKTVKRKSRKA